MEKKRKTKIQKWDEVGGAVETEVETIGDSFDETPGAGPSVSRNPMRGIEDMVEQNDNSFDGVINNLPEPKPVCQVDAAEVVEQEQKKKSFLFMPMNWFRSFMETNGLKKIFHWPLPALLVRRKKTPA